MSTEFQQAKKQGRRERNRIERRRLIVEAATASFLANGYAGMSMSGLIASIGGSKETLWSYFGSKSELFEAVVEEIAASFHHDLQLMLPPGGAVRSCLETFCLALLHRLEAAATLAAWRLIAAEGERFPELGRIFLDRAIRPAEDALARFVADAADAGALNDAPPEAMASMLLSLCWGRQGRVVWGDAYSAGYAEAEIDARRFVDWFMRVFGAAG